VSIFEVATQQFVCCRQTAAAADDLTTPAELVLPVVNVYYSGPLPLYNCSTPKVYHCFAIGGALVWYSCKVDKVENKYWWLCQVVRTDRAVCWASVQRQLWIGTVGLLGDQLESNCNI